MVREANAGLIDFTSIVTGVVFIAALIQISACTTTKTASGDIEKSPQRLELRAGDEIRVITNRRERFKLRITQVKPDGLTGITLNWKASKTPPDLKIELSYSDLAFIQIDKSSPAKTAGLMASVALIGGMVAAVTAAPIVVMP